MSKSNEHTPDGWEMLKHEEVPGFKKAFHIIVTIAIIYFIHIFVYTFFKTL